MPGEPSFIEIGVPGGSTARAFYDKLFGWTYRPMGHDSFAVQTPTIGMGLHSGDEDRNMVVYFAVDDIEATAARVRELGGKCGEPSTEQEGFGRFVECRDDQGVRFGLHQRPRP